MEMAKNYIIDCLLLEVYGLVLSYNAWMSSLIVLMQGSILSEADETPFSRLSEIYVDLHKFLEAKDSKVFKNFAQNYHVSSNIGTAKT